MLCSSEKLLRKNKFIMENKRKVNRTWEKTEVRSLKSSKQDLIYGIHRDQIIRIGNSLCSRNSHFPFRISSYSYVFRNTKQKLLQEIATILKITSDEVTSKLHSLKTQFNRESNRVKKQKSGSGVEDVYVSKWEYLSSLQFLNVRSVPGETISNLVKLFITLVEIKFLINFHGKMFVLERG